MVFLLCAFPTLTSFSTTRAPPYPTAAIPTGTTASTIFLEEIRFIPFIDFFDEQEHMISMTFFELN
jgi:hypothetical protein